MIGLAHSDGGKNARTCAEGGTVSVAKRGEAWRSVAKLGTHSKLGTFSKYGTYSKHGSYGEHGDHPRVKEGAYRVAVRPLP